MSDEKRRKRLAHLQAVVVFLVLQIGWFSCVLGAAWGLEWLGPVVVTILVLLHLLYSRSWRRDLALMLALGVFGLIFESLHVASGLIELKGQQGQLAPAWIVALWVHFGTMRHAALRLLFGRPVLAALSGAVAGPLAYLAGELLGAAVLNPPSWRALAVIAIAYGVVVPAASFFAWRGTSLQR